LVESCRERTFCNRSVAAVEKPVGTFTFRHCEVVILFKMRKSTASYDAISFFRMNKMPDGEIALRTMGR
jgi:hypothetical protein